MPGNDPRPLPSYRSLPLLAFVSLACANPPERPREPQPPGRSSFVHTPSTSSRGADAVLAPTPLRRATHKLSINLSFDAETLHGRSLEVGDSFWLLLHFQLPEGRHIYWLNPGETGLGTEARISAPQGFHLGPVQFPAPVRLQTQHGATSYGYEGQLTLLTRVTLATAEALKRPAAFSVWARWLSCSDVCVPETATRSLVLDTGHIQRLDPSLLDNALKTEVQAATAEWQITRLGRDRFQILPPSGRAVEYFPEYEFLAGETAPTPELAADGSLRISIPSACQRRPLHGVVGVAELTPTIRKELPAPSPKPHPSSKAALPGVAGSPLQFFRLELNTEDCARPTP